MAKPPVVNTLALTSAANLNLSAATSASLIAAQQEAVLKQKMIRIAIADVAKIIDPQLHSLTQRLSGERDNLRIEQTNLDEALSAYATSSTEGMLVHLIAALEGAFPESKPTVTAAATYNEPTIEKGVFTRAAHITTTLALNMHIADYSYRNSGVNLTKTIDTPIPPNIVRLHSNITDISDYITTLQRDITSLQEKRTQILTSAPKLELEMDRQLISGDTSSASALSAITASLAASIGLTTNEADTAGKPSTPRRKRV